MLEDCNLFDNVKILMRFLYIHLTELNEFLEYIILLDELMDLFIKQ